MYNVNPTVEKAIAQAKESRAAQVKAYDDNQALWDDTVRAASYVFGRLMDSPVRGVMIPMEAGNSNAVVVISASDQTLLVDVRQPAPGTQRLPDSPWNDIPDEGIIPDAPGACIILAHIPGLVVNRLPDLPAITIRLTAPDPDRQAVSYAVPRDDPRLGGNEPGVPRLLKLVHSVLCGP